MSFCMIQQHLWLIVSVLHAPLDSVNAAWCQDYACDDQVISTTGFYDCAGYWSCSGSTITVTGNGADCEGSHSCVGTSWVIKGDSKNLKCRGLFSCLNANIVMNDVSGYYDLTSTVGCYAEQSCLNSSIIGHTIKCSGDRSCANANIKVKDYLFSDGYTSSINSEIECYNSSTNECEFKFSGYFSAYNARIICGNANTCNVRCYGNACYGLTVICDKDDTTSTDCTINTICDVNGDNSDGICGNQGTIYPNNIYPILDNFQIPLLTNLDVTMDDNNNNIYSGDIDSVYSTYATNYDTVNTACSTSNPNSDTLVCHESWGCTGDAYGWILVLNITEKEYTGICCQGSYTCTWDWIALYDTVGVVSNDYTGDYDDLYSAWRCDGIGSCSGSIAEWGSWIADYDNITNPYPIYVYLSGESAWPYEEGDGAYWYETYLWSNINDNNYAIYFEIFAGGDSAALNGEIYASPGGSIYCSGEYSCAYLELHKIKHVYGVADASMEGIYVDSIYGSVYCVTIYACPWITISNMVNENENVYAFGTVAAYYSSFTNVQGSIIGYGTQALYQTTMKNIGGYIICIGNNTCEESVFNGVSKGIIAYGDNTLSGCQINTNYNGNSSVNTNVTIRINGTNDSGFFIKCNNFDYCNLYCESQYACTKLTFYCQWDHCNVECNNTGNNYDCPDIVWTGTRYPTSIPSYSPSVAPSAAPTVAYECNSNLQTDDTYVACLLLMELNISDYSNGLAWREKDYCVSDVFSDYFECFDDSTTIKTIRLNNLGIESELTHALISLIPPNVTHLDLGNNNFGGTIGDWSAFGTTLTQLETLKLNNNQFRGTIDVSSLSDMSHIKHINLANNQFTSLYGFSNLENMNNLEQLYLENNEIVSSFDLSYLPNNENFSILHCYNNSLYGNLVINHIPESLSEFICGDNDFGIIEWTYDEYSSNDYLLTTLDLSNSNLGGTITMDIFDITGGEFNNLKYIIMDNNPSLELEIDFEYLSGSNIELFSFLNVDTDGNECDFGYLTTFIKIKLDTSVVCDSSYCEDNSDETVSWYRNNDTCVGKSGCEATCECVTPYEAGLETYQDSGVVASLVFVLLIVIGVFSLCFCFGWFHSHGYFSIANGRFKRRDDFLYRACFAYLFQLWDFFSDLFLCLDIWDHYYQESVDSPDKNAYFTFWVLSAAFVIVPWSINLMFLIKSKSGWQKGWIEEYNEVNRMTSEEYGLGENGIQRSETGADNDDSSISALLHAQLYSNHWISRHAQLLVLLCMLSGGLSPSLKLVNSKLFGLDQFNMGLPKYKQDEATRHRLWLTVLFENVPQIIISTLYATVLLGEFDTTVLFALISSVLSVILAFVSFKLRFPKHHYIYELKCILKKSDDKLLSKLRQTNKISNAICEGMNQDGGYIFVENVFKVNDAAANTIVVMNIVGHHKFGKIDIGHELNIIDKLESKAGIWCQSVELHYIKHEIINLLTLKDVINYVCGQGSNKNNGDSDTRRRIEAGIKSSSISPIGSPTAEQSVVAAAHFDGNEEATMHVRPMASTDDPRMDEMVRAIEAENGNDNNDNVDNNNDENNHMHGAVSDIESHNDGDVNNNNKNDDNDDNTSFKRWRVNEVYEWFESILLTKDEFKDKKDEMFNFKLLLEKHMINGKLVDKMTSNSKYGDIIFQKLSNDSECAALVFEFEENIHHLATK